jgi:three-Cys-motif partner protein
MPSIKPKSLWEAKPHTLAKIEIVGRYLYLWFSILGAHSANRRLIYIDGFAGPGQYTNSDRSSPLAAMQAAKDAIERPGANVRNAEFLFLFVEKNQDFVKHLREVISVSRWPAQLQWDIEEGTFEEKVGGLLDRVREQRQTLAPTFAFVDPFGATGLPFSVVAEILRHPKCEVLLNLDSDGIGRLITAQQFEKNQQNLTALFGDESWKTLNPSAPMRKLSADVLALYKKRLRSLPDVRYVFAFAMNSREGQLNYHLVFASQHPLGLEKMKEAMKAVDKSGSYSFSDDTLGQTSLFDFNAAADWDAKSTWRRLASLHGISRLRIE